MIIKLTFERCDKTYKYKIKNCFKIIKLTNPYGKYIDLKFYCNNDDTISVESFTYNPTHEDCDYCIEFENEE